MNTFKGSRQKWAEVFENPNLSLELLKSQAVLPNSNLGIDGIRSVCWKVYLSCLPTLELSTWPFAMAKEREKYMELRKKYIKAVGSDDGPDPDLEVNNPLSLAEDSPWQQFFVDSELRKIIKQDVERTLPDNDYFRSEKIQDQLNDILFIYCKINQDVSYRQGMHELVAHILWVVSSESLDVGAEPEITSDSTLEAMKSVLDSNYIEHDAFALFSSLMSRAKPWYEFSDEGGASRRNRPTTNNHTQPFGKSESPEPTGKQTPVIEWSMKIFHYLERVDNELYLHLKELEIQPQLFGIRWFRLLFGREFPMEDVLVLWDGIFSQDPSLNICIFIGLALLLKIRDDLLQEDFSGCLHKLMRYPSVKDIKPFIPQALKLQKLPNAVGGQEVIRQNYVLEGKALPALPPVSDVDQGMHNQQQHSKRDGSPYARQASNHHDQSKNQTLVFSGNSGFVQHIPPAALDAIKPVAEGFVHATKNVLESKGGAALNKAIHDMRKNTQSYMRKANTPTSSASTSNFPPMFDQAISSNSRVIVPNQSANSSRSQVTNTSSSTSSGHGLDRQSQSQLGQIVAKALVVLEAEFTAHGRGNDDSKDNTPTETGDVAKAALKAKIAAFTGLEHVRDVLLGLSQEINPLVIESGMLESSTISVTNNKKLALSDSKPNIDQQSASPATMRRPANAVSASTKSGIPSSISSPVRSSFETSKEARPPSRSTSYTSGVLSVGSIEQEVPAPEVYIPAPPPLLPAKPFSFDDLIEDSVPNAKGSPLSSSPKGSGSSGVVSRVKSPRSSLAHSQFSWMLSDESVTSVASTVSSIAGQPSGTGGSNSSISQTLFSSTSPSPSQRMKIDPLAGSVSRRGGSGMSVASSGLTPISNQQNQDDDPLSL